MSLNPEASLLLSHSVGFRSPRANVKASEEISIESWLRLSDVSFWLVDRVRGQVCIVSLALSHQLSSMSSLNCLRRDVSVGKTRNASAALCPSLKYEACKRKEQNSFSKLYVWIAATLCVLKGTKDATFVVWT